jgi:PIN domain nuclease of toxin-antitoxin system
MTLLLDTNALIWLIGHADGSSLGPNARRKIQEADSVYVSSVSILEIRIKSMLGKLDVGQDLLTNITAAGLKTLSFDVTHADALTEFPDLKKHDPFDRMLLAQAQLERISLMTADTFLLALGLPYVMDARE